MRPPKHGCGDIRISYQVRERPRRLGLSPKPVPGDRHGLKQPIGDGATSSTNDRGPATGIGSGNVGEERRNPKFEAGADLMVGRGQDGAERLPENGGCDAGLLGVVEDSVDGVGGFLDCAFDSGVQGISRSGGGGGGGVVFV